MKRIMALLITCFILINCSTIDKKGVAIEEYNRLVWQSIGYQERDIFLEIKNIIGDSQIAVYAIVNSEYDQNYSSNLEQRIAQQTGIIVATRRTDILDRELNFQHSGRVSDEEMRRLGRMYGVNHILVIDSNLSPLNRNQNISNNDILRYTLYEIEKGLVLYSSDIALTIHRETINNKYYIISDDQTPISNLRTVSSLYFGQTLAETEIDFGIGMGVLNYLGFRPNKNRLNRVINGSYFHDVISSSETLLPHSFVHVENNMGFDERVKNFMQQNNLTLCVTSYVDSRGFFTYVVNYSFNRFKTFGTIRMVSFGYETLPNGNINITVPTARLFPDFGSARPNDFGVLLTLDEVQGKLNRYLVFYKSPVIYGENWGNHEYILTKFPDPFSNTIFYFFQERGESIYKSKLNNLTYTYNLSVLNVNDIDSFVLETVQLFNQTYGVNAVYRGNRTYFWDNVLYWGVWLRHISIQNQEYLEISVTFGTGNL